MLLNWVNALMELFNLTVPALHFLWFQLILPGSVSCGGLGNSEPE